MFKAMRTQPGLSNKLDTASEWEQKAMQVLARMPLLPSQNRYNLTISHQYKFIWFRVAKVGTRTILNYFKENAVPLDVEHASFIRYPYRKYRNYFAFALVRNPWDRLVSCWFDKVVRKNLFAFAEKEREKMKSFENFVQYVGQLDLHSSDRHIRLQSELIDLNNVHFVGRYESFEDDFKRILNYLGAPLSSLEKKNVSTDRLPYQEYYTDKLIDKVARLYQRDIQIFGYQFE